MRTKTAAVVVVSVLVLLSQFISANTENVRLEEAQVRATLGEAEVEVSLPVVAVAPGEVAARVWLLDAADRVVGEGETSAALKTGANSLQVRVPYKVASNKDLPWYRLRYRLESKADGATLAQGTVSVGVAARGLFDIRLVHPRTAAEGKPYDVRVRAYNPVTKVAVGGARLRGTLSFGEEEDAKRTAVTAITNSSGEATLRFRVPEKVAGDEAELRIEARSAGQVRKDEFDVELNKIGSIFINTDKMLYQPGQSFHARALVFDANRRAITDTDVEFTLQDPDEETVFRGASRTNKFGIANIDWELPESLRLGDYGLKVEVSESSRYSELTGGSTVRVSRYDLPEFTVAAKPDRSYYLGGQNAKVDVSAMYLFGKPVTRGSVRLVQEEERHWDYAAQKWQVRERAEQKGQLDATGHASFTLDLAQQHADLADKNYRRFTDLSYAAYITDASTGKTEQRRFKLRLSREPIHVYVSHMMKVGKNVSFYVSTSYPDGVPASCSVEISDLVEKTRPEGNVFSQIALQSIKTNRYGVGKALNLRLSGEGDSESHELVLTARDRAGASTRYEENVWLGGTRKEIQVTTDKTLYAKSEPIVVSLASEPMPGRVVLAALVKGAVVWNSTASLRRGKAMFIVPYQPSFTADVTITAYIITDEEYAWSIPFGSRTVLYPHNSELKVSVSTDRKSYRPGEPVTATLRATLADGVTDASALGVVVVDKAVEERVRTNEEFEGRSFGFWDWSWWYGDGSVGGISRQDLDKIDMSEPVSAELDLVAEVLLAQSSGYEVPAIEAPAGYGTTAQKLYRDRIVRELTPVRLAVTDSSVPGWQFPTSAAGLSKLLRAAGIEPDKLRDPWETPFKFEFDLNYQNRIVRMVSAGPDKHFGTEDDIADEIWWYYFTPTGVAINRALKEAYLESGLVARDYEALRAAVLRAGLDLNEVRDPWGRPYVYEIDVVSVFTRVQVISHGPTAPKEKWTRDMTVWSDHIDYFSLVRNRLDDAIRVYQKVTGALPHDDSDFEKALALVEFSNFRKLLDQWGHPYRVAYLKGEQYGDSVQIEAARSVTEKRRPVTQTVRLVLIVSDGPDGKPNTTDDSTLAKFSQIVAEQSGSDAAPKVVSSPALGEAVGAIEGIVTDPTGAVVPGATVTAEEQNRGLKFSATTDAKGAFVVRVTPGIYRVRVTFPGFREFEYRDISVHALSVTSLKVTLNVGATTETVEVQAEAVTLETSSAMVAGIKSRESTGKAQVKEEIFTPRLRDYFPETLYWAPSVVTGKSGTAKVNFKLADNITTWKMSVLASTADGHIGSADAEIQAFQPFFVALDPPKVLTVGDQIDLPVTVRNYLPSPQTVGIEMKTAEWFKLLSAGKQNVSVPTGDSTNAVFPFVTLLPVKAGKQQVLAANRTTGDAIEKPVSVHPDGREESASASVMLNSTEQMSLELPSEIMPNSLHAELKVYPNLLAHVADSIEASLQRPYGCGEQTISSSYPSLLLLQHHKAAGLPESELSRRARKYLKLGYQRLLNYRAADGGFNYWGHGEADVALTAYAIRFLSDASSLMQVDEDVIHGAQLWLVSAQKPDGTWKAHYGDDESTTAYAARILALSLTHDATEQMKTKLGASVTRALKRLEGSKAQMNEPYTMAVYALTAWNAGARNEAVAMAAKLRSVAHHEGNKSY